MGKTQTVSLDEQIRLAEKTLLNLKAEKEKQELKPWLIDSQFVNLRKSIENIAAHICIRNQENVFVVFEYVCESFYIDNNTDNFWFDDSDYCKERESLPYAHLPFGDNDGSLTNYHRYFGCIFIPVEKDKYTIESFK